MTVTTSLKEPEANGAIQGNGPNEARCTIIVEERAESPSERLVPTSHSHRATGGTRLLMGGAWTVLVIQVLVIGGHVIHGHVRNPSIEAFLLTPSSHSIAATLGILVGTTLPGTAAFAGGLSLYKRTGSQRGQGLALMAILSVAAMVGLQFAPTFSPANQWGMSTPSSRLVGHWESDNDAFWSDVEYGPMDSVGMATCYGPDGSVLFTFQILSEDRSGTRLVAREYLNRIALYNVEYRVPKDRCSMTKEYTFESGGRVLCEYRRVDMDQPTQQLRNTGRVLSVEPIAPQRDPSSTWTLESQVPPPLEVSAVVNMTGEREADARIVGARYLLLDRLREGYPISVYPLTKTDGSDISVLGDAVVTVWKITYMGPYEIRVEGRGKTWVHRIRGEGWQLTYDNPTDAHGPGLP